MTKKGGGDGRAAFQMHPGYFPAGSVKYPSLGSIVASEIGTKDFDLPHFVTIGNRAGSIGAGFLGMEYAPFIVGNPTQMPNNVELPAGINDKRFNRRFDLLKDLEEDFAKSGGAPRVTDHPGIYENASQLVLSPRLKAFDVSQEKDSIRDRSGRSSFGQGCLLPRRLVETGVTF